MSSQESNNNNLQDADTRACGSRVPGDVGAVAFERLLDTLNEGVVALDTDGRIIYANARASRMLGLSCEELLQRTYEHPDWKATLSTTRWATKSPFEQVLKTGEVISDIIVSFNRSDHVRLILNLSYTPLFDPDGQIESVVGTFTDITERARAEEEKSRLAAIMESTHDAVIGVTLDGVVVYWNQGAERLYGYGAGEAIGEYIDFIAPPELRNEVPKILELVMNGQSVEEQETERIRKNGERVAVAVTISPVRDAAGNVIGISSIAADITAEKLAREERERLLAEVTHRVAEQAAIMDSLADGLVIYNAQSEVTWANEVAEQLLFNNTPAEKAMSIQDRIASWHAETEEGLPFPSDQTPTALALCGITSRGTLMAIHRDDQILWISVSASPIHGTDGQILGAVSTVTDITERKQDEEQLRLIAQQRAALSELGQRAISELRLETLLTESLNTVSRTLSINFCEVFELRPIDEQLLLKAGIGWPNALIGHATINNGAFLNSELSSTPDTPELQILVNQIGELAAGQKFELSGGMAAVIPSLGRPYGVLVAHTTLKRTFSSRDHSFLRGVAEILGAVVEKTRFEAELRYLSIHDALTGLYNRAFFEEELARLERGRHFPVSIMMVDVDNLKLVNDSLGHAAGDELLRRTGTVLKRSFRAEELVARIGGDEFAILLPGMDAIAMAESVLRVRMVLAANNAMNGEIALNFSVGTATCTTQQSLNEALRYADEMMYQAKRSHRKTQQSLA